MSTFGETYIFLLEPITDYHIDLIDNYEDYLLSFGQDKGYSFVWEHFTADVNSYYQKQYVKHLGTEIKYKIKIWGKGEPIFRTVEALMKYLGAYYIHRIDKWTRPYLSGKYYKIYKRSKIGIPIYSLHLVDWEFIASYFNRTDSDEIRDIYNIARFEKEEYLFKDF